MHAAVRVLNDRAGVGVAPDRDRMQRILSSLAIKVFEVERVENLSLILLKPSQLRRHGLPRRILPQQREHGVVRAGLGIIGASLQYCTNRNGGPVSFLGIIHECIEQQR